MYECTFIYYFLHKLKAGGFVLGTHTQLLKVEEKNAFSF